METVLQNPWVRAGLAVAAVALVCFAMYALSFVLIPLLLAFLVAYVMDPVVDWFEARKMSRSFAIMVFAVVGLIILISIPLFAVPSLIDQADEFTQRARQFTVKTDSGDENMFVQWGRSAVEKLPLERLVDETGWREEFNSATDPVLDDEGEPVEPPPTAVIAWKIGETVRTNLMDWIRQYGGAAAATGQSAGASIAALLRSLGGGLVEVVVFLGNLAVFSFVAGFLLRDYDRVVAEIGKLVPPKRRSTVFRIMGKIDGQLRSFLIGQGTVCLALAVMYGIGLWLAGVPFAMAIALFGGFATLIPFFGVVMTFLPAAAFTLMYHGVGMNFVWVIVVFVIVQALEGNVITPFIMGQRVGLHPVWVILAVMVFGSLLGFTGLLVAVPLAAVLKVLVVEGVDWYKSSPLFIEDEQKEDLKEEKEAQ